MEVTLQDIANRLNVSAATVSRSLRNDKLINPETRARINETARRMGYKARVRRPRRTTESKAKSHALGLLLRSSSSHETARLDTNLMQMMAGVMAVTDSNRVLLHMHTIHHEEKRHMDQDPSVVPPMIQEAVCQAIIVRGEQDERDLNFLAKRVPVISMGRIYDALPMDAAVADNTQGVRALVAHLVELGHHRLAWVGAHYSASFLEARQAGFLQGCLGHNLELSRQQFFGPELFDGHWLRDTNSILAAVDAGVTAFVCGNDGIALRIIEVLEAAGRRVPDEVSVTGFDAWRSPDQRLQLTSVDPHFYDIGEAAARLAIQRISQPASQPCIVSVRCTIVIGGTTGPAPR
jgi:DNA-binding LacI/PurR family transcriptional regulator